MSDPIATSDIPLGDPGRGVFAFRKGDRVPAATVEENGWQDYVASDSTKAGRAAVAEAAGETSADHASTPTKASEKKG
jgi:hypothetical protein